MYKLIDDYIKSLLSNSTWDKPIWNIEKISQGKGPHWNYIDGVMINSLLQLYKITNDKQYLNFSDNFIDGYIDESGNILGYNKEDYNIDNICEGRVLFDLYNYTQKEKYKLAINKLKSQLDTHPRTKEGSFWHKLIYPNQVWLDGLYMSMPFLTQYENYFGNKNYQDIVLQYKNVRKNMYNEKDKLYYHAFDYSRNSFWCDKKTGNSKNYWLRAMGWYLVSLIDVIDYMDEMLYDEKRYLIDLFREGIKGILNYLDKDSNMFYQVINKGSLEGNYLETSGSAMISYAILKAVRLEVLQEKYFEIGKNIFDGICNRYLKEENNKLTLEGICLVAGLGPENNKKRDGSFEYYISEPVVKNDAKGVGPLIMAYIELIRQLD